MPLPEGSWRFLADDAAKSLTDGPVLGDGAGARDGLNLQLEADLEDVQRVAEEAGHAAAAEAGHDEVTLMGVWWFVIRIA